MAVYVDDMRAPYGRMIMCHCWADTNDELFAMMDKIGIQRKWFQQPPKASWEHFDISLTKRALAVRYGAIETDRYGPSEFESMRRFHRAVNAKDWHRAGRALTMLQTINRIRSRNGDT